MEDKCLSRRNLRICIMCQVKLWCNMKQTIVIVIKWLHEIEHFMTALWINICFIVHTKQHDTQWYKCIGITYGFHSFFYFSFTYKALVFLQRKTQDPYWSIRIAFGVPQKVCCACLICLIHATNVLQNEPLISAGLHFETFLVNCIIVFYVDN